MEGAEGWLSLRPGIGQFVEIEGARLRGEGQVGNEAEVIDRRGRPLDEFGKPRLDVGRWLAKPLW